MKIHVEQVTEENLNDVLTLEVLDNQKRFVESTEECLKEAKTAKCWRPVGIYDGEQLVGFSMYGFFRQYFPFGRVWLDRLLIDRRFQRLGYGKAALPILLERLWKEYHRKTIYLSVVEENAGAIHLYRSAGFFFTGELDVHGEKVMILRHLDRYLEDR